MKSSPKMSRLIGAIGLRSLRSHEEFCEHMIRQLLPDTPKTIFRPSIVLEDSRYPQTTQFDMVKAFVFLAGLPVLPSGRMTKSTS